jgi:hypothetical protein
LDVTGHDAVIASPGRTWPKRHCTFRAGRGRFCRRRSRTSSSRSSAAGTPASLPSGGLGRDALKAWHLAIYVWQGLILIDIRLFTDAAEA